VFRGPGRDPAKKPALSGDGQKFAFVLTGGIESSRLGFQGGTLQPFFAGGTLLEAEIHKGGKDDGI